MQPNEIIEVLNRPISQEQLLARDVTRLVYGAKDGTPRNVSIAFTWNGVAYRHVYDEERAQTGPGGLTLADAGEGHQPSQ